MSVDTFNHEPRRIIVRTRSRESARTNGQLGTENTTNTSSPVQVGSDTNWTTVTISGGSLAIRNDGSLWAWGGDEFIMGHGDNIARSSPVQVGTDTTWTNVITDGAATFATKSV